MLLEIQTFFLPQRDESREIDRTRSQADQSRQFCSQITRFYLKREPRYDARLKGRSRRRSE